LERTLSPFTLPPLTDDGDDGDDDDDDDDDAIRTAVGRPPSGQRRFSSFFHMYTLQVVPIKNLPT
jgi:hypothetical protein